MWGKLRVEEMYTPHPAKRMQTWNNEFFSGRYCLPRVHPYLNYLFSFFGASAVNIYSSGTINVYQLQTDPPPPAHWGSSLQLP